MEFHPLSEEAGKRSALPVIEPDDENALAAPLQVQEAAGIALEAKSITDLVATAQQENVQRKKLAFIAVAFAVQVGLITAFPHSPIAILAYLFSVFLVVFVVGIFAIRYRRTTAALAKVDDVRMVGPLIDRLRSGPKARRTRRVVKRALMRLLPRLRASDASLLTSTQKAELAHYLGRLALFQRDKELQVVILRALEQVGDAQAIPVVERIAGRQPRWSAQEQVHTAAVECLPFLRQRASEENARQTLLRSASYTSGDTGDLLHPAKGGIETDPRHLLRSEPSDLESPE